MAIIEVVDKKTGKIISSVQCDADRVDGLLQQFNLNADHERREFRVKE